MCPAAQDGDPKLERRALFIVAWVTKLTPARTASSASAKKRMPVGTWGISREAKMVRVRL